MMIEEDRLFTSVFLFLTPPSPITELFLFSTSLSTSTHKTISGLVERKQKKEQKKHHLFLLI
jgi:hypothetical protein